MRRVIPFTGLVLAAQLITNSLSAQFDRFAYAVTDIRNESANWNFLRKLNLQTGEYSPVLLQGNDATITVYDAVTRKPFSGPVQQQKAGQSNTAPFATGVAAMALDKNNNRLYYTPMFIDQLRYIDLKTMKVYYLTSQGFTGKPQKNPDQGDVITRMAIGSDGNGYSLSNDGAHLIQFTTGKNLSINDLGGVVDDQANKSISVHNSCTSYGGDMIADDDGNLYIFTARNHVFKINIETKVATHLGSISGLPAKFTVNGAAVTANNQIIVASAVEESAYYLVDTKNWAATPFKLKGTVWHSSDLANSNLLMTGNRPNAGSPSLISQLNANAGDGRLQIFPNPVTDYKFIVEFNQLAKGSYTLQVTDVMGRHILQQEINITGENQTQNVNLNPAVTKGVYMLKMTEHNNKSSFSTKVVVQ